MTQLCSHCGENFFKEDLNKEGLCKFCSGQMERYIKNEVVNSDD